MLTEDQARTYVLSAELIIDYRPPSQQLANDGLSPARIELSMFFASASSATAQSRRGQDFKGLAHTNHPGSVGSCKLTRTRR